jgi:hypothetical protein
MYVYTSIAVKKTSGDSSAQGKAWGIPSVFVALVRLWRLHGRLRLAVCMIVEIRLDRVSSTCQVCSERTTSPTEVQITPSLFTPAHPQHSCTRANKLHHVCTLKSRHFTHETSLTTCIYTLLSIHFTCRIYY